MAFLTFVLVHVFLPTSSGLSSVSQAHVDLAEPALDDVAAPQSTSEGDRRATGVAGVEDPHSSSQDITATAVIDDSGGVYLKDDVAAMLRVQLTSGYGVDVDAGYHGEVKVVVDVNASTPLRSSRVLHAAQQVQHVILRAMVWLRPCNPALLAALISLLADAWVQFAQRRGHRKSTGEHQPWEVRRSATFALFGAVYIGMIKRHLISLLPRPGQDTATEPMSWKAILLAQGHMCEFATMDSFLVVVFIGLPLFYIVRSFLETGISCTAVVGAVHRYRAMFVMDVLVGTLLWMPVDIAYFTAPDGAGASMSLCQASQCAWSFLLSLHWRASLESSPETIMRKAVVKLEIAAAANMAN